MAESIDSRADLRDALLDQLAYLVDEVEALRLVIDRIPEPLQAICPPGEAFSIKETYGLLAALDEEVHLPRFERMIAEADPAFDAVDEATLAAQDAWNDYPFDAILDQVRQARHCLVVFLRGLPPEAWTRTAHLGGERFDVYGLAHHITQHDADLLRSVGYRLWEVKGKG